MTNHFKSARAIYHHWLKKYGGDAIWHEEELIRDINQLLADRAMECNKVTLPVVAKMTKKIYGR